MSDDFYSGDELFEDINVQEPLQSQQRKRQGDFSVTLDPTSTKRQKPNATPRDIVADANDHTLSLARRILAEKFGYDNFRHEQEAAIENILAGKNTLVIFPTGAGKSLCFQVWHFCLLVAAITD
jgi:superfamily II DNA helicase RecQ